MIETTPMNADWFERLKARGLTAETVFEEGQYEVLKKVLLSIGGQAVIFLGAINNYNYLMTSPTLFEASDNKVIVKKGSPNDCYANVSKLCTLNQTLQPFEGFALSQDGVWRGHAWAYDYHNLRLIETTALRLAYFGATML